MPRKKGNRGYRYFEVSSLILRLVFHLLLLSSYLSHFHYVYSTFVLLILYFYSAYYYFIFLYLYFYSAYYSFISLYFYFYSAYYFFTLLLIHFCYAYYSFISLHLYFYSTFIILSLHFLQELWVSGGFGTEDDDGEADDEDSLQHVAHSVGEGRDALQSVVGQLGKNTEKERATSMSGG